MVERLDAYHFHEQEWDSYDDLRAAFEWEVPEQFNMADYVCERWAEETPDAVALYAEAAGGPDRTLTYGDLGEYTDRLANYLATQGVSRGDRVGVNVGQKPETVLAHVACWKLGAVSIPLSTLFGVDGLSYRLDDAEAVVCVVDAASVDTLREVRGDLAALETVLTVDVADPKEGETDLWAAIEGAGAGRAVAVRPRRPLGRDGPLDVDEEGFEPVARLVAQAAVTLLTQVLEGLAVSLPPVALLVVLARVRAGERRATGDTDDRRPVPVVPGAPHNSPQDPPPLSVCPWPRRRPVGPASFIRRPGVESGMQVKSRHHLRADEIDDLEATIAGGTGVELDGDTYEMVALGDEPFDVVLVDGAPDVVRFEDGEAFLTVQGANRHEVTTGVVTVDAGAISFVSDGADVMRPGIVDADPDVVAGDLVTIAEETHGKTLAVGRALVDGSEMVGDSGKVVTSLHHVGDELFEFDV